jgi:uncharacterized protein YjeT (DUF2065 family)
MHRTRLSLFYLATYLPIAGLLLLLVPDVATKLLLSNRTYDDVFTRLAGALLLALGILVIQIVRHRVEVLYPWTVVIRIGLCAVLFALYLKTSDPFFVVIFVVVLIGLVLTGGAYLVERRENAVQVQGR